MESNTVLILMFFILDFRLSSKASPLQWLSAT